MRFQIIFRLEFRSRGDCAASCATTPHRGDRTCAEIFPITDIHFKSREFAMDDYVAKLRG
jgi:hypothetical protein